MDVTLLGTGDTTGTPQLQCDCETCERARELSVERTRFSVHVRNERTGECLLVDASPDFRYQFQREDVGLPDAIVVTHIHFDHLDGLGNVYRLVEDVPVYAANETDPETGESVAETVRRRYDYLDAVTVEPETPFETVETCGFEVTLVPVDHPPLLCYGVVVEDPETGATLAMTGDTSFGIPERSRDRLSGADLLLVEGIVTADKCEYHPLGGTHHDSDGVPRTFGTKHMTIEGAHAMAAALDAAQYRIVHTSHFIDADDAFAESLAVDGEQYELS
ncbi:MBL fold metallo-hydrolase [Haloarculaceae archaeon H-GB2-1]|nr:MBL fold metallo-hydrolase [Haloarculaceae archaeon H-GB1-1]MEA5388835.1 MBL fold metallo-hydrolase [Haloarculaceae archaeon H-GB11]MEA5406893.1 MBL fold metallo-hydrolase [Haloarculaceae archaeon H-GB2-1]